MKRFGATFMAVLISTSVIFSGCGKEEKEQETKEEETVESNKEPEEEQHMQVSKEGWDPATNYDFKMDNIHIPLPQYAKITDRDNGLWKFETNSAGQGLAGMYVDYMDGVNYNEYSNRQSDRITLNTIDRVMNGIAAADTNNGYLIKEPYTVSDIAGYKAASMVTEAPNKVTQIYYTVIFNDMYQKTIELALIQNSTAKYIYVMDYKKMIANITADEPDISENVKAICDEFIAAQQDYSAHENESFDSPGRSAAIKRSEAARKAYYDLMNEIDTYPIQDQVYFHAAHYDVTDTIKTT